MSERKYQLNWFTNHFHADPFDASHRDNTRDIKNHHAETAEKETSLRKRQAFSFALNVHGHFGSHRSTLISVHRAVAYCWCWQKPWGGPMDPYHPYSREKNAPTSIHVPLRPPSQGGKPWPPPSHYWFPWVRVHSRGRVRCRSARCARVHRIT